MPDSDRDSRPSGWFNDVAVEHFPPPSALPNSVDILVIGGGLMGVSVIYWLAKKGLKTLLLETNYLGWGATGRNAGLMLGGGHELEEFELIREVLSTEKIEADYREPGHLALASSERVWQHIMTEALTSKNRRVQIHALDHAACESLLQMRLSSRFFGGRWMTQGALIHSLRFLYGLASAARRYGAVLATQTQALEFEIQTFANRVTVLTNRGRVHAQTVICACGAGVRNLLPPLKHIISPLRGQVLSTEKLPPLFKMGMAIDWGTVYWRQTTDGNIIIGGYRNLDPATETAESTTLNPVIQTALENVLQDIFPDIRPFHIQHRWAGIMDTSPDGKPIVGPLPRTPDLWTICGFGGHGMPAGLGTGKAVAEALVTGIIPESLQRWSPERFEDLALTR